MIPVLAGGTAGLKHVMLSEYVENAATIDVRQDTAFLPTVINPVFAAAVPGLSRGLVRGRYSEAPYASVASGGRVQGT